MDNLLNDAWVITIDELLLNNDDQYHWILDELSLIINTIEY